VRELANLLERLAILFPGQTISAADLPERYRGTLSVLRVTPPAEASVKQPTPFVAKSPVVEHLVMPEENETELDCIEESLNADMGELTAPQICDLFEGNLPTGGIDLKDHLSAIEIGLIRKALVEADGTVAEAARLLRIRRTTLVEKLRKYRLSA
jgi:sigma-54 specific flagellar transcriptional regulator A